MFKNRYFVLAVIVVIVFAVAISVLAKTLVTKGNAQIIELTTGQTAKIVLTENPSTGYSWHWNVANTNVVRIENEEFISAQNGLIGAPGEHVWNIKGLREGQSEIVLEYYRNWEPDKVEKTVIYKIKVH